MASILALDIGVASVGWAVVDKESYEVKELGSNLFPEGTAAQNQTRRGMRQAKRRSRRQRTRLEDFKKLWMQSHQKIYDPVEERLVDIRVKALREEVTEHELYLILYYALKHRGISYLEDAEEEEKGSSGYARALALNQRELETKYPCEIQQERFHLYGKYRGEVGSRLEDNSILSMNNVFTTGAYRKELLDTLEKQKEYHSFLTEDFITSYISIFNRKRKYYEGPGNELSRTDYGKYTTKIDVGTGEYITEKNIFEKLIGKCSVYPEEFRAAAASYTAQEFNVLNDLNNLLVNGRKLEEKEKIAIIETVKISDTVNMKKIIAKAIGEPIDAFSGARQDKKEKEIFHSFTAYNKMRKALAAIEFDITSFTREDLDTIGYILTINTETESIIDAFHDSTLDLEEAVIQCLLEVRRKNGSEFNKWHSFSLRIMNELIPEMYMQPKEQMTLLTEIGVFKSKAEEFADLPYIPVDTICEEMFNPVVRRSVRTAIRVINALLKKYDGFEEIVIEMPRDKNSDEEKKRISDMQALNEKEIKEVEKKIRDAYDYKIAKEEYSYQKNLGMKLKLWNEQEGICLYSGRSIRPQDIVENPDLFEIDHIIPRSISFDDSRNNKVLVYREENQRKGNTTPYQYLKNKYDAHWNFDIFKARVIELSKKKEYKLSKKKVENLLFNQDITKIEVLQGFISRNLNDTRYASRVVLNILQGFFKAKDKNTKIKVIRGSYTHQMRVNLKLDKNREESYAHHAVDAVLIAYSQMGYEAYRKLQGQFIDFETGEILDQRMYEENMSDKVYADYLYGSKWSQIRQYLMEAEKNVKYRHRVDTKCNRGLCNQTIRGSREYDGKIYKINKFDIRSKEGAKKFRELVWDSKKPEERERLLVYRNDRQTFEDLLKIWDAYKEAANPFVQYEKETGDVVRKYAKNHRGPKIECLKYKAGEVGSCIDISHKYGFEKGTKQVFLESLVPYRMDVYYHAVKGLYYLIGIKQSDIKCEKGVYRIDEDKYAEILYNEKMINKGQTRADLPALGYAFIMSFFKDEIISYEKNGEMYVERFLSRTMPDKKNYIETKPIDRSKFEKQNPVGLSKTKHIAKIRTDILGNQYYCTQEEFSEFC